MDSVDLQVFQSTAQWLKQGHRVVLVGVGNLGRALARYPGFDRRGFTMAGLFDSDPQIVGTRVGDLTIRHVDGLESGARELGATIGVVATPGEAAQQVCDVLVRSGVRSVLSFAPTPLEVPEHVEVRRVDLSVEMQVLSFNSARNDELAHAAGDARPTGMGQPMSSRATAVKATSAPHRASSGKSGPLGSTVTRNGSVIAP